MNPLHSFMSDFLDWKWVLRDNTRLFHNIPIIQRRISNSGCLLSGPYACPLIALGSITNSFFQLLFRHKCVNNSSMRAEGLISSQFIEGSSETRRTPNGADVTLQQCKSTTFKMKLPTALLFLYCQQTTFHAHNRDINCAQFLDCC